MDQKPQTRQRGALAAALCAIAVLIAGAASAAETAARITAVEGGTHVGDAAADRSAALGEDAAVRTDDDGNCALLVDEDALVELCSSTIMTLTRRPDTGNRVVKVDAGTTRIVVEPRTADEYIEIHTPAAIATIMGTIVFVEVDPVTGATKVTADNPTRVGSNDANVAGSSISSNMEQVTILPGEAPSQPKQISRTELANLGGCLVNFHEVALADDRSATRRNTQNRMAMGDGEQMTLVVSEEPPPAMVIDEPGGNDDLVDPEEVLENAEAPEEAGDHNGGSNGGSNGDPNGGSDDFPPDELPFPDPCGDIPGDACFPFPPA
jgi:hypothetical protein